MHCLLFSSNLLNRPPLRLIDLLSNRPNKSCQLSPRRYRSDNRLLVVAVLQLRKFLVQPLVGFRGDGQQPFGLISTPFLDRRPAVGSLLVRPGCLDQNPPQIPIARFRDRASPLSIAGAALARYHSRRSHESAALAY